MPSNFIFTPKTLFTAAALSSLFALQACGQSDINEAADTTISHAGNHVASGISPALYEAPIITNDRSQIGTVVLSQQEGQVRAHVKLSGITPGLHGVHFHAVGDCSDEKFLNTKAHINPMGHKHGLKHPEGPDNADMPNLEANAQGVVNQILVSPLVSFNGVSDEQPALFDADGSALVIHADPDDQITQPIGGAGARIGCAVIK